MTDGKDVETPASMKEARAKTGDQPDREAISTAMRLGWVLVELPALLRYGATAPPRPVATHHALSLRYERSVAERAIESERLIVDLATKIGVDQSQQLATKSRQALKTAQAASGASAAAINDLENFIFRWGERIQDELAIQSPRVSAGFQIGIGIAQIQWYVLPDGSAASEGDWMFLGYARIGELHRLVRSLAGRYDPTTLNALRISMWTWSIVAENPRLRSLARAMGPETRAALNRQCTIWRDLLLADLDATSLLTGEDVMAGLAIGSILSRYRGAVALALIGALCFAGFAYLVGINGTGSGSGALPPALSRAIGLALAVLGFFGITIAGITARAKTMAGEIMTALRQDILQDLVAAKALSMPQPLQKAVRSGQRPRFG